ncbi:MAG: hypothetical protein N2235_02405 [Fischerella sp.]|nr:hypothetical protein [Fischerella sp.]
MTNNDAIADLKILAGISHKGSWQPVKFESQGSNISLTGNQKAQIQKDRNIKPGTGAWFRLWFSKPYLTGEKPV